MNNDFLLETKLRKESPELFDNFKNAQVVMDKTLSKIDSLFPNFTNHSMRHCLKVIEFCNTLITEENIDKLNVDEVYILLMAILFHDFGMSISKKNFDELADKVVPSSYYEKYKDVSTETTIRTFHHLFSATLFEKYADIFEIPDEKYIECISKTAKGHRKVDLFDENEYSPNYKLNNGNNVCLPYLSVLIRLSDELDIARDRNPIYLYESHTEFNHWMKHFSIEHLNTYDDYFELEISIAGKEVMDVINEDVGKLINTLDYCNEVVDKKTSFEIKQKRIDIKYI